MSVVTAQERLQQILRELHHELQTLNSQGVLNRSDVEKIKNQAKVSNDALLRTIDEPAFQSGTRDKVLLALVADFENSVQGYLEGAVERKGERALLIYRLNKTDRKIQSSLQKSANDRFLSAMSAAMFATRTYILASLPQSRGIFGSSVKIDEIVANYNHALTELLQEYETKQKIRIVG